MAVGLDLADDRDRPSIAVFCPDCVEREFGGQIPDGGIRLERSAEDDGAGARGCPQLECAS
jgi:hypothetical protein